MGRIAAVLAALLAGVLWAPAAAAEQVVCTFEDQRLTEISGMTRSIEHPGVLWLHNDSSGGPYLYAVDERTCKTLTRLRIDGIDARDLEGIAASRSKAGRGLLWLGDIGDNRDSWPKVFVHRIREPKDLGAPELTAKAKTFPLTYPDGPHNAETLLAAPTGRRLWIVTRQLAQGTLYRLPMSQRGTITAKAIQPEGALITDGAVSPDGSRYVLRDYVNAVIYDGLPPGRQTMKIQLPVQTQGEAVAWTADGEALLVASERDNRLLRVELQAPASSSASATPSASAPSAEPTASASASASTAEPTSTSWVTVLAVGLIAAAAALLIGIEIRRRA